MSETSSGAVFLSYASQDAEAASRIAEALRTAGITVWFDQAELAGGDAWDKKIRDQIKRCALFLPLISANSQARSEGYFRLEWKLAAQRTHMMSERSAFLLPIVIDETPDAIADVPSEFKAVQWTRLRYESFGGQAPLQPNSPALVKFTQRVQSLLNGVTDSQPSISAVTPQQIQGPARPANKVLSSFIIGAITAILISVGAAIWSSLSTKASETQSADVTLPTTSADNAVELDDKSIAVLPFANMSEDPAANSFFADGVHEDLLTNLAYISALRVVSRTSVMQYRDTQKPVRQIAAELGVGTLLEGSVRRAGDHVRVTAQLIDATTDEHIWAQTYDRELKDIFAIQSELAKAIASALRIALTQQFSETLAKPKTENLAAYELFLRDRELVNRDGNSPHRIQQSIALLQRAVTLDPNFALAWGTLGATYAGSYFWGFERTPERLELATRAIEKARFLAPEDLDVQNQIGTYYYYGFRDYERAAEYFERILAVAPNHVDALASMGYIRRRQGRWAQSTALLKQALAIDPRNQGILSGLSETYASNNHWVESISYLETMLKIDPTNIGNEENLANVRAQQTRSPAPLREFVERHRALDPNVTPALVTPMRILAGLDRNWVELEKLLQLDDNFSSSADTKITCVILWRLQGRNAEADALLSRTLTQIKAVVTDRPLDFKSRETLIKSLALAGQADEAHRELEILKASYLALDDALVGNEWRITEVTMLAWSGHVEEAVAALRELLHYPMTTVGTLDAKSSIYWQPLWDLPSFKALLEDPNAWAPLPID